MQAGFLGLGAMGAPMARNLHKAGLLTGVWNRSAAKATALAAELGCRAATDPAALAADCDLFVLCVSADADVLEVIRALAPAVRAGTLVIDCSTVSADTARSAAALLAARGAAFLDCPVSGGVEGARTRLARDHVRWRRSGFRTRTAMYEAMGKTVRWFGGHGAGQATKATNQIMCAASSARSARRWRSLAQRLPLERIVETLGQGAGSSWYFVNRAPNVIRGSFPAGFRVRLHEKDLHICRDMAAAGVALPVVEDVLREYAELIRRGYGDEDISSVYRLKQEMFDTAPFRNPPLDEIFGLLRRVRNIAVVGLSADPARPSHGVARSAASASVTA
jgi:3-hydroxyisobutyrate dehydrogenase